MWETVIGLETHVELSTGTKIFCGCPTAFGAEPNTQVCPVCAGLPGALPVLNDSVVDFALKTGLALNCSITQNCKFDRKNYFYPDLPKSYQISQLYAPICTNGWVEIETDNQKKKIRIREIHMEEDAGKLVHDTKRAGTFIDLNRAGVPLLEIVTEPDFRGADEVLAYLESLKEILVYLGVSDCKMQEGSLRVDLNLSVRLRGGEYGVRTEMKNLNSFKAIGRAAECEAVRQIRLLENGGRVIQQTRRWDDERGESFGMRSKENAHDYRYFPDPDLLPLEIDDARLARIKGQIGEPGCQKRERYVRNYGLSRDEAVILTAHKKLSELFEDIVRYGGEPREAVHLITGDIMRLCNETGTPAENLTIDAQKLAVLILLVKDGKINRNAFRETVEAVFTQDADPGVFIAAKGLFMVSDDSVVISAAEAVLSENPSAVADYRAGKEKAFGFFMGQTMKRLLGAANPDVVRKILLEMLGKR